MSDHSLDYRLEADTLAITQLEMSGLLLMNDSRWPWLILVPRIKNACEWHEIERSVRLTLDREIESVATALKKVTACEKINIASLGNIVRQLHIHIIARNEGDTNWPAPVWGFGKKTEYEKEAADDFIAAIQKNLQTDN